jgi:hypothetical protein
MHHTTMPSDRDGGVTCDIEAGTFEVLALPRRLQDPSAQVQIWSAAKADPDPLARYRLPLGSVTAEPGKPTELEVRLPPEWER